MDSTGFIFYRRKKGHYSSRNPVVPFDYGGKCRARREDPKQVCAWGEVR